MEVLLDYCVQQKAYGDSYGKCIIRLDNSETIIDVIKKYVEPPREWWQQKYMNPIACRCYSEKLGFYVPKTYIGNLVVLDTFQIYLD